MGKFTPSSKSRPCDVCGDAKGKCRHTPDELRLCMNYAGRDDLLGWRFLGNTRNDLWGKFVPDDGESGKSWQDRQEEIAKRIERDRAREQEKLKYALPVDERSAEFRKLLLQLNLEEDHYQDLLKRGLTDQEIQSGLYRTVTPNQQIKEVKGNLPGIWNNKIIVSGRGYLCPVWDEYGRIVGCQVRLDQTDDEGGKYRWLKGKFPSHLPNGELPLTVVKGEENGIYLVEGILKPDIAQKRHGGTWIGASGGNFASSPEQLKRILGNVASKDEPIYFASDAGSLPNPHTARRDRKTVELVQSLGYEVYVLDWGQLQDKSVGDADEVSQKQFANANLISGTDFLEFPKPDFDAPEFIEPNPEEYEAFERELEEEEVRAEAEKERDREVLKANYPVAVWNSYRKLKRFTPNTEINKQYLAIDDIPGVTEEKQIIAIKSALGTGKTQVMAEIINLLYDEGWLYIGHRNNLQIQSCGRWDMIHLKSAESEGEIIQKLIGDTNSKIACCFDSLIKFDPDDFDGRNLILDETVAGIIHLFTAKTEVSRNLQRTLELFTEALQRAKRVFCLDGMLSDVVVNYIAKLTPEKTVTKLQNNHKNPTKITHFLGTEEEIDGQLIQRKNDRAPLVEMMRNSPCPVVVSDSQLLCAAIEEIFKNQGRHGYRIDGETSGEDWAKSFLKNPNEFVSTNQPEFLIFSPAMESGNSIDIKNYFTDQFAFFFGAIGTDAQHQMLFRLRDLSIPRYVWIKEFDSTSEKLRSPFPRTNLRNHKAMLVRDLQNAVAEGEDITPYYEALCQMDQQNPHDLMFSNLESIYEHERSNLKECLIESLKTAGHEINEISLDKIEGDKIESNARDEVKRRYSEEIFNARDIDEIEIDDYKQSGKWEDQCAVAKKLLKLKLPGIEETYHELWTAETIRRLKYDERDLIRQLERWWMYLNMDKAKTLQQKKWSKALEGKIHKYHLRSDYSKILALKEAGVEQFFLKGQEWSEDSPTVKQFIQNCKKHDFKLAFGKSPGKKTQAVRWINTCLDFFGARLTQSRRAEKENGERVRFYTFTNPLEVDATRPAFYECIAKRLTNVAQSEAENANTTPENQANGTESQKEGQTPASSETQSRPATPNEYIYNTGFAGRKFNPNDTAVTENDFKEENNSAGDSNLSVEEANYQFDINSGYGNTEMEVGLIEKVKAVEDYDPLDFNSPSVWQQFKLNSQQPEGQKQQYRSRRLSLLGPEAQQIKEALLSIQSKADLSFFKENVPYVGLTNRVWRDLLTQEQREAIERIKNGTGEPDNVAYGDFEKSHTTDVSDRAQPAQPANTHPPLAEYEIGQRVYFMNEKGQWRKGFIADSRWLHDGDFKNWQFRGWLCRESKWQMEGGTIIPYQQCIMPLISDTA